MADTAIKVEGLAKSYMIRHEGRERYTALRDVIMRRAKWLAKAATKSLRNTETAHNKKVLISKKERFWALKDVSFNVKQGERIAIIGRNGAGKSTLLKLLSRITYPSEGKFEMQGHVASLLEVGTGFHPELTGRENVFLNGSILGMSRKEIQKKFDEIVAFSEVEKFLDTPMKRYSSGMQVRLAFAVAAHLNAEILLVDEVLAVGDAEFQKKCLGKMGEIADSGRTILFVSHNMQAVQSLCSRAIHLEAGQIINEGNARAIVAKYLSAGGNSGSEMAWPLDVAPGNSDFKLTRFRVCSPDGSLRKFLSSSEDVIIQYEFECKAIISALCVGFDLCTHDGVIVIRSFQTDMAEPQWPQFKIGTNKWQCTIPKQLLNGGVYKIYPRIGVHNMYWIVNLDDALSVEITLDHGVSPLWNILTGKNHAGTIAPILNWQEANVEN